MNVYPVRPSSEWLTRNLIRGLEYEDGLNHISLSLSKNWASLVLYVTVTPKDTASNNNRTIQFFSTWDSGLVSDERNTLRFDDLVGNGENSGFRGQGYGTFCVNIANQVWNCILTEDQQRKTVVTGKTCPESGDESDVKGRNRFWESFGLVVAEPGQKSSLISCEFSGWIISEKCSEKTKIEASLSLSEFWPVFHRRKLLPCDELVLDRLAGNKKYYDIPTQSEIFSLRKKERKDLKLIASVGGVLCGFSLHQFVLVFASLSTFNNVLLAIALMSIGFLSAQLASILGVFDQYKEYLPISDKIKRLEKLRDRRQNELRDLLKPIIPNENGFVFRVVSQIVREGKSHPAFSSKQKRIISDSGIYCLGMDDLDLFEISKIIEFVHEYIKSSTNRDSINGDIDFLFGDVNKLSISDLSQHAKELKENFDYHINRALSIAPNNTLTLHSGVSYERLNIILSELDHIARVEIYSKSHGGKFSTINIKLFLKQGVLNLKAIWAGWKEIRLEEVMDVIVDLDKEFKKSLISKTFLNFGNKFESFESPELLMIGVVDLLGESYYSEKYISETMTNKVSIRERDKVRN